MHNWFIFPGLCLLSMLGVTLSSQPLENVQADSLTGARTLVLYDAASGTIPSESLMDFTDFPPGAASLTYLDGSTVMDTTLSGSETYGGWVSGQAITPEFPILDRTTGFQVNFILQVESEAHSRNNRAGFGLIVLDQDAKGIELSFWENEIWAQNDDLTGGLFTHGEGTPFPTTTGLTEYQVAIVGDTYSLTANSEPILSGPLRDYSNFDGFPDPYQSPNILFLGDDTTSAQARLRLRFVSVTGTQPIPPAITATGTSTGSPLPAASSTPQPGPSAIPAPTSTPTGKFIELCPSGWLLFLLVIVNSIVIKKIK